MIKIDGIYCPRKLVANAYKMSRPVGMGLLHYREGDIPEEVLEALVSRLDSPNGTVSMDYVLGRQCKFCIFKRDNEMFIEDYWYDHSPEQFKALLEASKV